MKSLLFFTALIATANALICQCTGPTCEKDTSTCTIEAGKCYSVEREIFAEKENPGKQTIKGCQDDKVEPNICKEGFILMSSEKSFHLISNVFCCNDKDSCNKDIVPQLNKTIPTSKRYCPSCFALDKKTCDGKSMFCNDLQKNCFNIVGTITKGAAKAQDFSAKGCAVKNTIFKTNFTLLSEGTTYKLENVQFQETNGGATMISNCLSFAVLLPSIVWFLLDSSLY